MKINESQLRNTIKESVVKFLREEMVARHASERNHQHQWEFTPGDTKFNYMLLSRLQMDCDYFLGNGNRYEKNLWAGNVNDHIEMMKKIWNGFEEKPEWLSMEQIEDYERKMKNNDTNNDIDGMKINESQLRNIIKESIQTILKESAYDINSPEYKQMYDSGNKWYDGRDTKYDHTSKEIEDYEALPDKARHPYGAEIPDFSDRIKDRWAIHDTLARKGQNSILRKQQNKREFLEMVKSFSPFFLMWCSSNKGMSKEEVKTLPDKELISLYRQYLRHRHEGIRKRRPI